jgi:transposase
MADFLDVKLTEIRDRLTELRPLVDEFRRLEAAESALSGLDRDAGAAGGGSDGDATPATSRRKNKSSRRSQSHGSAARPRRGRPKGNGNRATEALELVRQHPGITISELAEAMGIQQNYLYRVMPDLAERGQVYKDGRGWHARRDAEEDAVAADDLAGANVASAEAEPPSASTSGETSTAEEAASTDDAVE